MAAVCFQLSMTLPMQPLSWWRPKLQATFELAKSSKRCKNIRGTALVPKALGAAAAQNSRSQTRTRRLWHRNAPSNCLSSDHCLCSRASFLDSLSTPGRFRAEPVVLFWPDARPHQVLQIAVAKLHMPRELAAAGGRFTFGSSEGGTQLQR